MELKHTILIMLCMFVLVSGCQYHPKSSEASSILAVSSQASSELNRISDVSIPPSVPLGSSFTLEEYKAILQPYLNNDEFIKFVEAYNVHPSPDGKNQFIEIAACRGYLNGDWENYVSYLFFNDFDHFVEDYLYEFMETVKWINNGHALIDKETIIDIGTGQMHIIMDNSYFDDIERSYIVESDVNAAGTRIATFNRLHPLEYWIKPSMQYLYLYDVAEDKWQLLFEAQYLYEDTRDPRAFLKWKTDDCLEFCLHNGAKFNFIISTGEVIEITNSQ